jgi:hypothetical protein
MGQTSGLHHLQRAMLGEKLGVVLGLVLSEPHPGIGSVDPALDGVQQL